MPPTLPLLHTSRVTPLDGCAPSTLPPLHAFRAASATCPRAASHLLHHLRCAPPRRASRCPVCASPSSFSRALVVVARARQQVSRWWQPRTSYVPATCPLSRHQSSWSWQGSCSGFSLVVGPGFALGGSRVSGKGGAVARGIPHGNPTLWASR
jgi:hypothetical protein